MIASLSFDLIGLHIEQVTGFPNSNGNTVAATNQLS